MWVFILRPVNLEWHWEQSDANVAVWAGHSTSASASDTYECLHHCMWAFMRAACLSLTLLLKCLTCWFIVGHYGAFLQEEWDLLQRMSKSLEGPHSGEASL